MQHHHHGAETLARERICHISLEGEGRRYAGDIDAREQSGDKACQQGCRCRKGNQGRLLREAERHIHYPFRGERRAYRGDDAQGEGIGGKAEEHGFKHHSQAQRAYTASEYLPGIHALDAHWRKRGEEGGVVDASDEEHDDGDADEYPHLTAAAVLVDRAAGILEIDVLHRGELDAGEPVALVVERVVEGLLYEFPAVRGVQQQVAVEVRSTVSALLDVSDIEVDFVAHLGVLREILIDCADNQILAPVIAEDAFLVVGDDLPQGGFAAEKFSCKGLWDCNRAQVGQSFGVAFGKTGPEYLEQLRVHYVYAALERFAHPAV